MIKNVKRFPTRICCFDTWIRDLRTRISLIETDFSQVSIHGVGVIGVQVGKIGVEIWVWWCVWKWGVVWKAGVRCDCFVFVWVYEKGHLAVSSSKA